MSEPPKDPRALRRAVPVDRYATILAHVVHFGPDKRAAVLERFGLDQGDWEALDPTWCADLRSVPRRQQANLAMQFTSVFARTRLQLAEEQPAVEHVGDATPKKPVLQPPVEPAAEPPAEPLIPTYKLEKRAAPALTSWQPEPAALVAPPAVVTKPPAEDVAGTADISTFVPREALPFAPQAAGAPPPIHPVVAPQAPSKPALGSGTVDITSLVAQAVTPFAGPAANPQKRLIRFDPQTGQPLPEARWEEVSPEPGPGDPAKQ
jgi:hypothetical protein